MASELIEEPTLLIRQPLPFVQEFVTALDEALRAHDRASQELSQLQQR